jgi:hypothetical protein
MNIMNLTITDIPEFNLSFFLNTLVHSIFLRETYLDFITCYLTLYSSVFTMCTICFNVLKLCILPTQCICVLRMVLTINSDYFPKQH